MFVHLYDLHMPYRLPPGFTPGPEVTGYDAQLQYVDEAVGSFRKNLVETGWWDQSLVVLFSDHGEGLGEHGETSHGLFLYESTLRVPLIFRWPSGTAPLPPRIDQPVGLIDVAPTVLDFLQLPAPGTFAGRSLMNPRADRPVYSESLNGHNSFGWAPLRSLRDARFKYIDAPRPELYDLLNDPNERRNLAPGRRAAVLDYRSRLAKLVARYPARWPAQPRDQPPQTIALLRSLGYLQARQPRTWTTPVRIRRTAWWSSTCMRTRCSPFRKAASIRQSSFCGESSPAILTTRWPCATSAPAIWSAISTPKRGNCSDGW